MKAGKQGRRPTQTMPAMYKLCGALLTMAVCTTPVLAQDAGTPQTYSVTAGSLADALDQLARQSRMQIIYPAELVRGKRVPALSGQQTWRQAIGKLLAGSGLEWKVINNTTVAIRKAESAPGKSSSVHEKPSAAAEQKVAELQAMVVTGTRIRGGVTASPVITIGSEQIRQEGFTNLGEVIRSIPQNFNGGQNPGVIGATSGVGNQDFTGGSSLNLRGLGADASLTLLNGHRLAYDGFSQAVDISAIPVEAVERLEIVPDGASAIYGSDAVGGVANVILRRDFDGVTLGARYGGATEGGMATREYTATAGTTWASGGLIATFKSADVDPIYTRQRSYTRHQIDPYTVPHTIYNGSKLHSGLVSVHQSLGDVAELKLDALRTRRDMTRYFFGQSGSYYHYSPQTSITLVSPGVTFFLGHDWSISLGGTYGKDDNLDKRHLVSAAGTRLTTLISTNNKSRSWEVGAEGPIFPVGGGDARLAVGIGSRKNEFWTVPKLSGSAYGSAYGGGERARFAYAELNVPFVSPASGVPGVHRLELSAALRGEDYDSFGRVTTPKFGVIYDPTADFTLKVSWGKSFKAPTLLQRYQSKYVYLWNVSSVGASGVPTDATALMSYGGNANLQAERARTWSASVALHPEALPGLDAELTWFDIDYTDRVVQPVNYTQALGNPIYADFVNTSPTLEQMQDLFAVYGASFLNVSGKAYDPGKVVAIIHDQYVNAARQRIKGLDLSGSYHFDIGDDRLTVRGSASWLDSAQATSAGQPEYPLAGTVFNPARFNGRIGAVWASGGFTVSGFVNYVGGVTNRLSTTTEEMASFTTVDTAINYDLGDRAGVFSGLALGLSVQNLLDRAPPLYTAAIATLVPYDATNYSAIGRFVSLSVSKHW